MTSNLGSEYLLSGNGKKQQDQVMVLLKKSFRPEFLNRIDEIVLFNSLGEDVVDKIVEKFLNQLKGRLENKQITLTYDQKAVEYIHKHSYDPVYGARPIRRYVQSNIETPIATKIISGEIYKSVHLSSDGNKLIFSSDNKN